MRIFPILKIKKFNVDDDIVIAINFKTFPEFLCCVFGHKYKLDYRNNSGLCYFVCERCKDESS